MRFPRKIYAIQHNVTKRIYIGSSKDADKRYLSHIYKLRSGKHPVEDMQSDFNKYGEDYSFFILEEITEYSERTKEYEWMKKYNSYKRGFGYNYMDHCKISTCTKTIPPYKEGLPEPFHKGEENERKIDKND